MLEKWSKLLIVLVLLSSLMPFQLAAADVGPKPTMDFDFSPALEGGQVTIVSGKLFECEQPDCSDAQELEQLGPQGFDCDARSCHAIAYGFSQYHRIEIVFSDGRTLQSNVFEEAGWLRSKYKVSIQNDRLLVEAKFNLIQSPTSIVVLCIAIPLVLVVVVIVIILALVRSRARKK